MPPCFLTRVALPRISRKNLRCSLRSNNGSCVSVMHGCWAGHSSRGMDDFASSIGINIISSIRSVPSSYQRSLRSRSRYRFILQHTTPSKHHTFSALILFTMGSSGSAMGITIGLSIGIPALLFTVLYCQVWCQKLRHQYRQRIPTPGSNFAYNEIELHACSTRADMPPMVRHGLAAARIRAVRDSGRIVSSQQAGPPGNLP